jgi:hypothetical protein
MSLRSTLSVVVLFVGEVPIGGQREYAEALEQRVRSLGEHVRALAWTAGDQ